MGLSLFMKGGTDLEGERNHEPSGYGMNEIMQQLMRGDKHLLAKMAKNNIILP